MFGKLVSYKLDGNVIHIKFKNKDAYLIFVNDKVVRVSEELNDESFAVEKNSYEKVDLIISKDDNLEVTTKFLKIIVSDNFLVDFYTLDGREICIEYKDTVEIVEADVDMSLAELEGHAVSEKAKEYKTFISKKLHNDEAFYGLGDKTGFINKRAYDYIMWNTDDPSTHTEFYRALYKSMPFFIGIHSGLSYGIFYDDTYKSFFDMGKTSTDYFSIASVDGKLNYYFIYGDDIPEIVEHYTFLTGRTPMPQIWTLGNQQSRWSYPNEEEVRRIAKGYIDNNVPLDVIHLDIDYMDNYKIFTTSKIAFPNFKDLVDELKSHNIKVVPILDPGTKIEAGYDFYEEGIKNGYFALDTEGNVYENVVWPGPSVYPNFISSEVRSWWADNIKKLLDLGVRGIWTDMNEPASFKGPLPDDVVFPGDKRDYLHKEIHNVYGHLMAEATYDGLKKHDNRRPFVITRASYSGTQKYSTAWTGDNQSLWAHLQMSIPQLSNMGLSGLIFVGTDVGGFGSDTTKELLIRWVQAGLFAPLFRNHSSMGTRSQEPWAFDDETTNIYRKYLNLRYEVIPYLYDLFFVHQTTGAPIMRPLVYHYQDDVLTHNINDEYLVGENLLVAPVVEQGKTKKLVYLPKGKWVDYNTLDIYEGGTYVIIDAPLDVLPMFVKFNSMLVKYEAKNNIDPNDRTNLIVELYGNSATYSHYLDDGESFKYLEGEYQIYNFEYSNGEFKVELQKEYAKNYKSIEVRHRNKVVLIEGNKNTNIKI